MKYRWHDGFTFTAADAPQAIAKLRAGAVWPAGTVDAYKRELAFRSGEWAGRSVRFCSAEAMVADLIANGLLERTG